MNNISARSFFVYIVECADKTLYTGYTNNLEKRIQEHNTAKNGARYTRTRRPVLLRYSEKLPTLSDALKREHEIKSWTRARKDQLLNTA